MKSWLLAAVMACVAVLGFAVTASATVTISTSGSYPTLEVEGDSADDNIVVDVGAKDSDDHYIIEVSADGVAPDMGSISPGLADCTDESTYLSCEMQDLDYVLEVIDSSGSNSLKLTGDSDLTDELNSYSLSLQSPDTDRMSIDLPTTCDAGVGVDLEDDEDQDQKDSLLVQGGCNRSLDIALKDGAPDTYMVKDRGMARSDISITKDKFPTDFGFFWSSSFSTSWHGHFGSH